MYIDTSLDVRLHRSEPRLVHEHDHTYKGRDSFRLSQEQRHIVHLGNDTIPKGVAINFGSLTQPRIHLSWPIHY